MKEIKTERTVYDVHYEASDGTIFYVKGECEDYERTAKCAILSQLKAIVLDEISEEDFCDGSCDFMLLVTKPKVQKDVDIIMRTISLFNSSQEYLDNIAKKVMSAMETGDSVVLYRNCDDVYGFYFLASEYMEKIGKYLRVKENHDGCKGCI